MIRSIYHIGTVPCHKYSHRYCTQCTYAHICSLRSLARKRTAFHAYSERQDQQDTYMTALSRQYRSRVQWLRQCNDKASGPYKCAASPEHTLSASGLLRTELPSHLPSPSTPKQSPTFCS